MTEGLYNCSQGSCSAPRILLQTFKFHRSWTSPSAFEPEKAGLLLNLRLKPQALAHCLELAHRLDFPCYVRDRGRLLRREQKRGDETPFPIAFDSHWNGTSSASPLKSVQLTASLVPKRPRLDARFGDLESKFSQLQAVAEPLYANC